MTKTKELTSHPIYKPDLNIKLLYSTEKLIPVIHSGLKGCFELAFYLTKKLDKNKTIYSGYIKMADGYIPYKDGEMVCCSFCGKLIQKIKISNKNGEYEVF